MLERWERNEYIKRVFTSCQLTHAILSRANERHWQNHGDPNFLSYRWYWQYPMPLIFRDVLTKAKLTPPPDANKLALIKHLMLESWERNRYNEHNLVPIAVLITTNRVTGPGGFLHVHYLASRTCTDPHKVNIYFSVYHVGNGQPWILPNFWAVEQKMLW